VTAKFGGGTVDTGFVGLQVGGVTYVPTVNVAVQLNATNEVAVLLAQLEDGNPNWRGVENTYAVGAYFTQPQLFAYDPRQTLRSVAKLAFPGTLYFDKASAFFGSATWVDDFVQQVLANQDGTWSNAGARAEALKKSLIDGAMVNAALGKLQSALAPSLSPAERSRLWDEGWAFYVGRDPALSPYATSNKRALNYGTMSSTPGVSRVNEAVLRALVAGKLAVSRPTQRKRSRAILMDQPSANAAFNAVLQGVQTTYLQAALRYAFKTDANLAAGVSTLENRAEGGAFWRVVAPFVAERDAAGAAAITEMYDIRRTVAPSPTTTHYYYCLTKRVLLGALPVGVTPEDIGTLEDDDGSVSCGEVARSPPAAVAPLPPHLTPDCTCKCCSADACPVARFTYGIFAAVRRWKKVANREIRVWHGATGKGT
jgi:hypothetical protein